MAEGCHERPAVRQISLMMMMILRLFNFIPPRVCSYSVIHISNDKKVSEHSVLVFVIDNLRNSVCFPTIYKC